MGMDLRVIDFFVHLKDPHGKYHVHFISAELIITLIEKKII
jgi:hypothetical protein